MKKLLVTAIALTLAVTGCKKKEETPAAPPAPATATGGTAPATGGTAPATGGTAPATGGTAPATGGTAQTPDPTADYLRIAADHVDPAKGKVDVIFSKWTVKAAKFDPANLEGGTAEIEVDPSLLASGIDKRDAHLKTADYLDVVKFPTATVKVANVKKTGDKAYTAEATVNIHGVEKTWTLPFEVVSSTADSVQIKFNYPFSRADFSIGPVEVDNVKTEVELQGQLTLKNT
jgi:polyisoprenoid-binding protein YceI